MGLSDQEVVNATEAPGKRLLSKYPSVPYVAPFAVFVGFLMLEKFLPGGTGFLYPIRVIAVLAVLISCSRSVIDFRVKHAVGSTLLGVAVFVIWVAPDVLWPHYRGFWLFTNSVMGAVSSSAPAALRSGISFILFRTFGCVVLVPILEELFWTALSRPPTKQERKNCLAGLDSAKDRRAELEDVLWGLLNSKDFLFRR